MLLFENTFFYCFNATGVEERRPLKEICVLYSKLLLNNNLPLKSRCQPILLPQSMSYNAPYVLRLIHKCNDNCSRANLFLSVITDPAEAVEESHGPATAEEISGLEEFIPTRLTCLSLLQITVTVSMAEFNLLHTLMPVIMRRKVSAHIKDLYKV